MAGLAVPAVRRPHPDFLPILDGLQNRRRRAQLGQGAVDGGGVGMADHNPVVGHEEDIPIGNGRDAGDRLAQVGQQQVDAGHPDHLAVFPNGHAQAAHDGLLGHLVDVGVDDGFLAGLEGDGEIRLGPFIGVVVVLEDHPSILAVGERHIPAIGGLPGLAGEFRIPAVEPLGEEDGPGPEVEGLGFDQADEHLIDDLPRQVRALSQHPLEAVGQGAGGGQRLDHGNGQFGAMAIGRGPGGRHGIFEGQLAGSPGDQRGNPQECRHRDGAHQQEPPDLAVVGPDEILHAPPPSSRCWCEAGRASRRPASANAWAAWCLPSSLPQTGAPVTPSFGVGGSGSHRIDPGTTPAVQ
jgi:hypothetical protein